MTKGTSVAKSERAIGPSKSASRTARPPSVEQMGQCMFVILQPPIDRRTDAVVIAGGDGLLAFA